MKKCNFSRSSLAAMVAAIFAASAAHAAIISQTYTFPDTNVDGGLHVLVAPFDPSNGTLTRVEVISSGAVKAAVSFVDLGSASTFSNAFTSGPITLGGPGVSDLVNVAVSGLSGNLVAGFPPAQIFPDPGAGSSLADDVVMDSPSIPSEYVGASSIDFSLTAGSFTSGASLGAHTGQIFVGGDAVTASAGFDVIYTFTPVPEPASMALLGLGVIGLLARRRRA